MRNFEPVVVEGGPRLRTLLGLLLPGLLSAASISSSANYQTDCVYLSGPNAVPVTVSNIGANGSNSCSPTAQVVVGNTTYTGNLSGSASSTATAGVVYGVLSVQAMTFGAGPIGSGGAATASGNFTDGLTFFGTGGGYAGFELVTSVSESRSDATSTLLPSIAFMLNGVARAQPVLGYPGAPGQPDPGSVSNTAAVAAYFVPFTDGRVIPFSLAAGISALAGNASLADMTLAITVQIRLYDGAGVPINSCTYQSDSNQPYTVFCAPNFTATPEPGSAWLLGIGALGFSLWRRRS